MDVKEIENLAKEAKNVRELRTAIDDYCMSVNATLSEYKEALSHASGVFNSVRTKYFVRIASAPDGRKFVNVTRSGASGAPLDSRSSRILNCSLEMASSIIEMLQSLKVSDLETNVPAGEAGKWTQIGASAGPGGSES